MTRSLGADSTPASNQKMRVQVIYDVDDDNALTTPAEGVPHADSPFAPASTRTFAVGPEAIAHNPYGCFGGPANVWPRGFPLDAVNDDDSTRCDVVAVSESDGVEGKARPLGVVQALANHDPDVDAIYRLTFPPGGLPFSFEGSTEPPAGDSSLKVVPPAAFTPYNAQVRTRSTGARSSFCYCRCCCCCVVVADGCGWVRLLV